MWFYSFLLYFVLFTSLIAEHYGVQKQAFWTNCIFLIFIAALRPPESCHDYMGYVDYYNVLDKLSLTEIEPTFYIIAKFSRIIFDDYTEIFYIYAVLGVLSKGLGIIRLTNFYWLSLVLYVGSFYQLHELTQIRVGVASAFILLSIPSIVDRKIYSFIFFFIMGILFHYSFMLFGVFYFLNPKKINVKYYFSLIILSFIAYLLHFNISSFFSLIKLDIVSQKIETYKMLLDKGVFTDIKILNNPLIYLRVILAFWFIFKAGFLYTKNRYSIIMVKIYVFSIVFFIVLSDLPTLAGRISELLRIVEIILVPFIIYLLNPKYIAIILAIMYALLIMYKQLYYSDLMYPYFN